MTRVVARVVAVVLSLSLMALVGCKPKHEPAPPGTLEKARDQSAEGPLPDLVVSSFSVGDVAQIRRKMTLDLRARLSLASLTAASEQLREQFGQPMGILEEHTHTEDDLRWYSGLVLYGTAGGRARLTPVLYQFAYSPQGSIARLLVREHWFIETIDPPADDYVPITRFHFPSRGEYTVLHGGRTRAQNYHHPHRAQRFAWDLVVKKNGRQRPPGSRKTNDSFYCYGKDILAPAAGTVVTAINDVAENRPGERGARGGNGVVIDHGFGEYSAIWHAIPGSVVVRVGDRVEVGQVLAKVGNSGRSTGPHIHFHVSYREEQRDGKLVERFGLPVELVDVVVDGSWYPRRMPVRGETVQRAVEVRRSLASGPRVFVDI
jgi:murein DD-endopeptidase MepM/ murein hydrolase activator NlpD